MLSCKITSLYCSHNSYIYADKLAKSHIMPGTNCKTAGYNTSLKHNGIIIFKIPKAKSEIPEHKKWKKEHMNK